MYKYSLDKSSKKFVCPNCNKKTFVKFINNESKLYLNNIDGRCDRESKCGYFKKPSENMFETRNTNFVDEIIQPTYHKNEIIQTYYNEKQHCNFIKYLLKHFNFENVLQSIGKYHIGSTNYWQNATVFWQIDNCNMIRAGKIMLYNSVSGKRVKQPFNHVSWIHKQQKLNNFVLQQCLFGLHQINEIGKGDTICIVESEKTAIIMSIVAPKYLWLASGSKTGFKKEMLQPIKEFNIIAYPDKTEYQTWNQKATQLNNEGFKICCSNFLENIDLEEGADLVDFLFKIC